MYACACVYIPNQSIEEHYINNISKIQLETIPSTQESHEEKSLVHFKYSIDFFLPEQGFAESVQTLDPLVDPEKNIKCSYSSIFQVTILSILSVSGIN